MIQTFFYYFQEKLLGSKSSDFEGRLKELETILDVFNITMNRNGVHKIMKFKIIMAINIKMFIACRLIFIKYV